jgi:O-antigen ligase
MGSVIANYYMKTGRYARFPKLTNSEWALLGYYFAVVISVLILPDKSSAFSIIFDITKDILVGISIFFILNTQERWKSGLNTLVVTVTILAALGVFKTATGSEITFFDLARNSLFGQVGEENELRYGGPIGEPNLWGQVLVSTIPFIFYKIRQESSVRTKSMLFISLGLVFLAMIYTSSRGAVVAFLVMLILIAIDIKAKPSNIFIACAMLIAIFIVLPESYQKRFSFLNFFSNNSLEQDSSVSSRNTAMQIGLEMFRDNPVLGVGFGNYRNNYWDYAISLGLESSATNITNYSENAQFVHSLYIEILSETGLVGFLTFALFVGALLSGLYQIRNKLKDSPLHKEWAVLVIALAMSIFTFLVSGFFLHGVFFRYIWVLIGLAMAAISISNDIRRIPFARQHSLKELPSE